MEMAFETIALVAAGLAVFALLWILHRDVRALRRDMLGGIGSLRQDMRGDMEALRQDMHGGMEALRRDVRDISARMAKVEGMLAGASLRISLGPG